MMLHVGLDLSRRRLDVCVLGPDGSRLAVTTAPPDRDGLRLLVDRLARDHGSGPVLAVIESMNGARFVHDTLEGCGWSVEVADARKVKGLGPLACKTDRIDAWVLAELSRRDLVPAIWLPGPAVRGARELARFRLHVVHHRTALKNRVHATLMAFGHPCPLADLFGVAGRDVLDRLAWPEPWRGDVEAALRLIDVLSDQVAELEADLRADGAEHPYVPLLLSVPGWAAFGLHLRGRFWRFCRPRQHAQAVRLNHAQVYQSGSADHRGSLAKNGPKYLRWALIEAATTAARHPSTPPATSAWRPGWAASGARKWPGWTWPADWPRPSGTC